MNSDKVETYLKILTSDDDDWFADFNGEENEYRCFTWTYIIQCKDMLNELHSLIGSDCLDEEYKAICHCLHNIIYSDSDADEHHQYYDEYEAPYVMKHYKDTTISVIKKFIIKALGKANIDFETMSQELYKHIKDEIHAALDSRAFNDIVKICKSSGKRLSMIDAIISERESNTNNPIPDINKMKKAYYDLKMCFEDDDDHEYFTDSDDEDVF